MESKQKTLYMSRQLIEFNHIYKGLMMYTVRLRQR